MWLVIHVLVIVCFWGRSYGASKAGRGGELLNVLNASLEATSAPFCFVSFGCWGGLPSERHRQRRVAASVIAVDRAINRDVLGGRTPVDIRIPSFPPMEHVRLLVTLGDNFYFDGVSSVDDPQFDEVFEQPYDYLHDIPYLAILGNHDLRGDANAQVEYTRIGRAGQTTWYMPQRYYSVPFQSISTVFLMLDCPLLEACRPPEETRNHEEGHPANCVEPRSQQMHWLIDELRKWHEAGMRWKIVACHYPLYSLGHHANEEWLADDLEPLFAKYGVSLYLNADNHYQQASHKSGVEIINSGGGAGGTLHSGVFHNPFSHFYRKGDGVMSHCIPTDGSDSMTHRAHDANGFIVKKWTTLVHPTSRNYTRRTVTTQPVTTQPVAAAPTATAAARPMKVISPLTPPPPPLRTRLQLPTLGLPRMNTATNGVTTLRFAQLTGVGMVIGFGLGLWALRYRRGLRRLGLRVR